MAQLQMMWSWFVHSPDYISHSPLFPNPLICLRDMVKVGLVESYSRLPRSGLKVWFKEMADWLQATVSIDWDIFFLSLAVAIALTVLRVLLDRLLLKRIPVWLKLPKDAAEKLPESIFKGGVSIVTWSWATYLVFFATDQDLFFNLLAHWELWHPGSPVDPAVFWLFVFEIGLYLHCIYGTVFLDTIRKDSWVLTVHHILTIFLLLFSYAVRYHLISVLLLFILDVGDVWLEISKTFLYFKVRDGKDHAGPELGANISFAVFTVQYILFRLYWFPVKVLYSAMYVSVKFYPGGPFWSLFVIMLWALYAMQVYWFKFIVELLVRILRKEELKDTRDFEEDKGQDQSASNGLVSRPLLTRGEGEQRSGHETTHQRELHSKPGGFGLRRQPLHAS